MDTLALLKQMLILLAMITVGYIAFKKKLFDKEGQHQFSTIIVKIANPILLVQSAIGTTDERMYALVRQNLLLSVLYFAFLIVVSSVSVMFLRKTPKKDRALVQLMLGFSNLGFLGIPLIRGLFGSEYVIFLVPYLLLFNILMYTYGMVLNARMAGEEVRFDLRRLVNVGTVSGLIAILVFFLDIPVPAPVQSFMTYMGDMCIPVPMMMIGASLAQLSLAKVFLNWKNYAFCAFRMLAVPALAILLFRNLPVAPELLQIFFLLMCMPVAALVGMMAEEYARRGDEANQMIAMTTLLSVITIPLMSLLY